MTPATVSRGTPAQVLPALIARQGDRAALRFLEFFTVNIRNRNTRAAYGRAAADFLRWCEGQGIGELGRVQPVHVAAYIELLQGRRCMAALDQSDNRLSSGGTAARMGAHQHVSVRRDSHLTGGSNGNVRLAITAVGTTYPASDLSVFVYG